MGPLNLRKIKNFFKSKFHRPTVHVGKTNILFGITFICIIIIAFLVRIFPILYTYPILDEFDTWAQYRLTSYIIQNGYLAMFTFVDPQAWYPAGYPMYSFFPGLPFSAATLYNIINFFGIKMPLLEFVVWFPSIMGTVATVMMYFLGDILSNKKTGLLASFFLAVSPAYLQRTKAGFFDNETMGIFLMIFTLYFFIRSLKNDSLISALVSGLGLGAFMCSWGGSAYILDLLPLTAFLLVLLKKYSRRLLINYTITIGVGIFIASRIPVYTIGMIYQLTTLIPIGMIGLLLLCELYQKWKNTATIKSFKENWRKFFGVVLLGLIIFLGFLWLSDTLDDFLTLLEKLPVVGIGGRNLAVLNPLSAAFITQSVGEHLPSPWGVYYYNLHVLLIFLPIGFYFLFKRLREEDLLIILFGITTIYFSGSFIRLLLILAPSATLISAFGIISLLKPFSQIFRKKYVLVRRRKRYANLINRQTSIGVFALVGFLLVLYSVHGIYTAGYQLNMSAMMPAGLYDWEETWSWMRSTLPPGTVICSWWDYGYWISKAGNMTSNADNGTINATQIALIGRMFMASDEQESIKILKMLGSKYVLVHWGFYTGIGGDEGKWVWMLKIGYENPILNIVTYPLVIWDYYIDQTGLPNATFFESTIWKMLTCGEQYFPDAAAYTDIQASNFLVATFHYRLHTNVDAKGVLWANHFPFTNYTDYFPSLGNVYNHPAWAISYNGDPTKTPSLKYFDLAYASKYHLVKIYKINYELAGLQAQIKNVTLYNNGISLIDIKNSGEDNFSITSIKIGGTDVTSSIDVVSGPAINNVTSGNELLLRTTGTAFAINTTQSVQITIQDLADSTKKNPDIKYSTIVQAAPSYNMTILPDQTFVYSNETAFITVKNTNQSYIKIDEIDFQNDTTNVNFTRGYFQDVNGSSSVILNQNEIKTIIIPPISMTWQGKFTNLVPNSIYNITVKCTAENLSSVITKTVISNTSCITLLNPVAYGNESVFFAINNTGSTDVTINRIYLGASYFNYYSTPNPDGGYVLNPAKTQNFSVNWYPEHDKLDLNVSETVFMNIITSEIMDPEAINSKFLTIVNAPGYSINVTDEAYSNETLYINVNNTGIYPVEISDFWINNFPTTNFNATIKPAYNHTLDPNEEVRFRVKTQYNLNYTNLPVIKARTFEGAENSTIVWVNFSGAINITSAVANFKGYAIVNVSNVGDSPLIVKEFTVITATNSYLIDSNNFTAIDGSIALNLNENRSFNLTLPSEIAHSTSLRLKVNVTTWEGAYDVDNLTWNVGLLIENAWLIENGTVKVALRNIGVSNLSIYQLTIILNQTETFNSSKMTPANVSLGSEGFETINVTSNLINGNFSKYAIMNVSANYTSSLSDLVFAIPQTINGSLFILSQSKNITIVKGFPYTVAFDNGTYAQGVRNDTLKITIMNSGSENITIYKFELYNGSWINFNFTDATGVLSYQNYTLKPYDQVIFYNYSINNNYSSNYIELNVSNILSIRVNTTTNNIDRVNLTIVQNFANITIRPMNITFASDATNEINVTITNFGDTILVLSSIMVNSSFQAIVNSSDFYSLDRTLNPGDTKIYIVTPSGGIAGGNSYLIRVETVNPTVIAERQVIGY